jgi:hypothetical protein
MFTLNTTHSLTPLLHSSRIKTSDLFCLHILTILRGLPAVLLDVILHNTKVHQTGIKLMPRSSKYLFLAIGLTRPRLELTMYITRGELANYCTNDWVRNIIDMQQTPSKSNSTSLSIRKTYNLNSKSALITKSKYILKNS